MGQVGSSLADSACDGDIQSLKAALQHRKQQQQQHSTPSKGSLVPDKTAAVGASTAIDDSERWCTDIEEAMHAVVGMEIHSAQQFQQLQIALELLLQAQPEAWASTASSAARWTGAHRACVTGNLSFLAFVFQHYDAFDVQERDAFGLFPIDLVPPEALRTPAEMVRDAALEPRVGGATPIFPATARSRRNLALQILRQKKSEAQARCVDQFLFHEHATQRPATKSLTVAIDKQSMCSASNNQKDNQNDNIATNIDVQICRATDSTITDDVKDAPLPADTDNCDNQTEDAPLSSSSSSPDPELIAATGASFIAFEPSCERLAASAGAQHDRSTPLRLKYRFPRIDEFVNGYFQLIWRAGDREPRSEEPHYGSYVLVRDEVFLDPQCLDLFAGDAQDRALNLQEQTAVDGLAEEQTLRHHTRRLEDRNPVLQGCFPFDVSSLPADAVCNVLFVACDRHLMRRTVVLSTEAIALSDATDDGSDDLDIERDSTSDDNDDSDDSDIESDASGFLFHVAGEAFRHPNAAFDGQSFAGVDDFEVFVKALRANSNSSIAPNQQSMQPSAKEEGGSNDAAASTERAVAIRVDEQREPEATTSPVNDAHPHDLDDSQPLHDHELSMMSQDTENQDTQDNHDSNDQM